MGYLNIYYRTELQLNICKLTVNCVNSLGQTLLMTKLFVISNTKIKIHIATINIFFCIFKYIIATKPEYELHLNHDKI